jgi:uncharacterized membrane protein
MAEKYSFIVIKYPQKETAEAALAVALTLAKEKVVRLKDAVAITKTEKEGHFTKPRMTRLVKVS